MFLPTYSNDELETGLGKVAEATMNLDHIHSEAMLPDLSIQPDVAALNTKENELSEKHRSAVLQAEHNGAID